MFGRRFDGAGADGETLRHEGGIGQAGDGSAEVPALAAQALLRFGRRRADPLQGLQPRRAPLFPEGLQAGRRPSGGRRGPWPMQRMGQRPQVLAGMVEVHDLGPLPKVLRRQVPDPRRASAQHHHRAEAGQPGARPLALPVHHV
jgi:hypothetical protein